MLIDSHCHVNFKEFEGEIDEVIKRALDNNTWLINVGSNYLTSQKSIEIAERYKEGVYATVGIHPIHLVKDIIETAVFDNKEYSFKTKKEEFNYAKYKSLAMSSKKVVGIGEVGLDFFRLEDEKHSIEKIKKDQSQIMTECVRLAKELNLPLVLHARGETNNPYEVGDLMIYILKSENAGPGVMHCFAGNLEQAKKFLDLGFYIGFTGIVTFKNAKEVQEAAKYVPIDRLLIETDSPFLAPEPFRGKRNEPLYVKYVAEKIAALKSLSYDQVTEQTFLNAKQLFKI